MGKELKSKKPMCLRELSKTAKSCTECISMRAASMRDSLKMTNSMGRDTSKMRTEASIKVHSKTVDSTGTGSSNGQMDRNIEETIIWDSAKAMENSSILKIQAFPGVFGVTGC